MHTDASRYTVAPEIFRLGFVMPLKVLVRVDDQPEPHKTPDLARPLSPAWMTETTQPSFPR